MSYQTPEVGTILLAKENVDIVNPGPVQTATGDGLNEWLQAQAQDTAFDRNKVIAEEYVNNFNSSWLYNYTQGRTPFDAEPPKPTAAVVIVVRSAEAGGVYFDMLPSGQYETADGPSTGPYIPVCEVPAYTKKTQ